MLTVRLFTSVPRSRNCSHALQRPANGCLPIVLSYPGERSVHRDDFGVEASVEALNDYQLKLYVFAVKSKGSTSSS